MSWVGEGSCSFGRNPEGCGEQQSQLRGRPQKRFMIMAVHRE